MAKSQDWINKKYLGNPDSDAGADSATFAPGEEEWAASHFDDYQYYAEAAAAYWSSRSESDDGLVAPFRGDDQSNPSGRH